MDKATERVRRIGKHRRLARATVQYFNTLTAETLCEERSIAAWLRDAATE